MNLQQRTQAQLLADFDGQLPEQLKVLNLIYTMFANAPPAGSVSVVDGQTVKPLSATGTDLSSVFNTTASVTAGTFTGVKIPLTVSWLTTASAVTVQNSAGTTRDTAATITQDPTTNVISAIKLSANRAVVADADVISVTNSATADGHNATAAVAAGVITSLKFAATVAMVDNADTTTVTDATGVANGQVAASPATVAAGVLTGITLPGTNKIVKTGVAYACPAPTGTYASTITLTISAAGAITAVTLA